MYYKTPRTNIQSIVISILSDEFIFRPNKEIDKIIDVIINNVYGTNKDVSIEIIEDVIGLNPDRANNKVLSLYKSLNSIINIVRSEIKKDDYESRSNRKKE